MTRVGVIACGALALHVKAIARRRGWDVDVHPLPPELHNRPELIAPAVAELAGELEGAYDRLVVAYADCGSMGAIDRLGVERLAGEHCYDVFAGDDVRQAMEEEPGTYFLTDFLARTFDRTVWRSLGLDRHPDLRDAYFKNYRRVVYLAQRPTPELRAAAARAAAKLGLPLEERDVGEGGLERRLEELVEGARMPETVTTRAALLPAAGTPLRVVELELAPPGPGEVRVRLHASGVCGDDLNAIDGSVEIPCPVVPGHEGAGVVEEIGEGVRGLAPGDHVALSWAPYCGTCEQCLRDLPHLCGTAWPLMLAGGMLDGTTRLSFGGATVHHYCFLSSFAERAVVPERSCVRIPEEVPFEVAALVGCAVTSGVGAVWRTAGVRPDERVAVFGLGGTGMSSDPRLGRRRCVADRRRRRAPRPAGARARGGGHGDGRVRRRAGGCRGCGRRGERRRGGLRVRVAREAGGGAGGVPLDQGPGRGRHDGRAARRRRDLAPRHLDPAHGAARARLDLRVVAPRPRLPRDPEPLSPGPAAARAADLAPHVARRGERRRGRRALGRGDPRRAPARVATLPGVDTRMPSDREVLALALPALGALVAEPLYVLGDTAIIGHLGTVPLAGLALAGLLLSEILGFCTFLEYGTTARAARLYGAGDLERALDAGVQATWLALGLGALSSW